MAEAKLSKPRVFITFVNIGIAIASIIIITITPNVINNFFYNNLAINLKIKSNIIANKAAAIAPNNINDALLRSIPNKIKSPRVRLPN